MYGHTHKSRKLHSPLEDVWRNHRNNSRADHFQVHATWHMDCHMDREDSCFTYHVTSFIVIVCLSGIEPETPL